jgi:NAD(P)-dependent dehydrogenase (short-subunit alcohol dehydrogenase family)
MTAAMSDQSSAVVVTGASGGIGFATSRALVARGFRVFGSHLPSEDAGPLQAAGVTPFALDVTALDGVRAARDAVLAALGTAPLAGLVNNAGIAEGGPVELVDLEAVRANLEVNILGPFAVTQAFLPRLRADRGRVVNISSISGRLAMPFLAPYCASKFALEAFSDCLRRELLPFGVDVIVIQPAMARTPIWDRVEREDLSRYAGTPYERVAPVLYRRLLKGRTKGLDPAQVAAAVVRALTEAHPPTRIPVLRTRTRYLLAGLLPDRVIDRMVAKKLWK